MVDDVYKVTNVWQCNKVNHVKMDVTKLIMLHKILWLEIMLTIPRDVDQPQLQRCGQAAMQSSTKYLSKYSQDQTKYLSKYSQN